MGRRRLLGDEQSPVLFVLPEGERDVVRHCTLSPDDLAFVTCAVRHPVRALEPGERHPRPWPPLSRGSWPG